VTNIISEKENENKKLFVLLLIASEAFTLESKFMIRLFYDGIHYMLIHFTDQICLYRMSKVSEAHPLSFPLAGELCFEQKAYKVFDRNFLSQKYAF